jgi:hypothetical protein
MLKPGLNSIRFISSTKNDVMKHGLHLFLWVLIFRIGSSDLKAEAFAQGPLGGPQIAVIENLQGFVQVARAATPLNPMRVSQLNFALANGDKVQTLAGMAQIRFTDASILVMNPGTVVIITERQVAGGIQRTISQFLGTLWFNISKAAGTTTLQTPTAVAAIRGTTGTHDVPNPDQSTHALQEGLEQITEIVTQQSVLLRPGQRITAIHAVGFTPAVAIIGALRQPVIGGGGSGAAGGAGGAAGAASGAAASASVTAATTVTSLAASITSIGISAGAAVVTATIPLTVSNGNGKSGTTPPPPGGAIQIGGRKGQFTAKETNSSSVDVPFAQSQSAFSPAPMNQYLNPSSPFISRLGGTVPITAATGSMWLAGALTHDQRLQYTGIKSTRAVLTADIYAEAMKQFALRQTSRYIDYRASGNAVRTFALASVISRQYHDKPLAVVGSYGFATAVSFASIRGPKRFPSDVLISAAVGEVIGRVMARHHNQNHDD